MNRDFSQALNSSLVRKSNARGSQAPQMKNSRNIMIENFMRNDIACPSLSYNDSGYHVKNWRATLQGSLSPCKSTSTACGSKPHALRVISGLPGVRQHWS